MENSASSAAFVTTPNGPLPASNIVELTPDQVAYAAGDGRVVVEDNASGRIVAEHGVPFGAGRTEDAPALRDDPREAMQAVIGSKAGIGNYMGYYAHADYLSNMKEFRTTWTVPDPPKYADASQTFYLWNGFNAGLLQCVLVWGAGEARYRVQNWGWLYGGDDGNTRYAVVGPAVPVKPGGEVTGVVTLDDSSKGYKYSMVFEEYPETKLTVLRSSEPWQVVECFESYTKDVDFITRSKKVAMNNIHIKWSTPLAGPATLDWQVGGTPVPVVNGSNTVVVSDSSSDGEIDFYFDWTR